MATSPVSQTGFQGLREGLFRVQEAATRIVQSSGSGDIDALTEALVDLKSAELQAKASAKVIESANETVGTLIDVLA